MNNEIDKFYHASNISNPDKILPLSKMHGTNEQVCYFALNKVYGLFYLRDMKINHAPCSVD